MRNAPYMEHPPIEHARLEHDDAGEKLITERALKGGVHLCFCWRGGIYIDIGRVGGRAVEVINIEDYSRDVRDLDSEKGTFDRKVDEWIAEYGEDELIHDVTFNWCY